MEETVSDKIYLPTHFISKKKNEQREGKLNLSLKGEGDIMGRMHSHIHSGGENYIKTNIMLLVRYYHKLGPVVCWKEIFKQGKFQCPLSTRHTKQK